MHFKEWLENQYQPVLPLFQQEDPPPDVNRFKNLDNYIKKMTQGSRKTEQSAQKVVSAPPGTLMAPRNEEIVNIIPGALVIPSFTFPSGLTRPENKIAFVFLRSKEPLNPLVPEFNKFQYRLLAYWQGKSSTFDKEEITDGFTRPIGGLVGQGGYITHAWVDKDYRGNRAGIPNLFKALMQFAQKMGIHGILPEHTQCPKCGTDVIVGSRPQKCPNCGTMVQPLTSKSFRIAQAKHDWERATN